MQIFGDNGSRIPFLWESEEITPAKISEIKGSSLIYAKAIWIRYKCELDFTLQIKYVKGDQNETENVLQYPISSGSTYFYQELPNGLLCKSIIFSYFGEVLGTFEVISKGIMADIISIGRRA